MKNTQSGRSMVEMLGVLAIIGMLSVGGIWGLSEAIERHKLNKSAAQLSAIFHAVSAHIYDNRPTSGTLPLIPYFKYKTPALFDDMPFFKSGSSGYLQDAMGSSIMIYTYGGSGQTIVEIAEENLMSLDTGVAYCRNVLSVLQQVFRDNPEKFDNITFWLRIINKSKYMTSVYDFVNMSVGQITNFCYDTLTTGKGSYRLYVFFRNRPR